MLMIFCLLRPGNKNDYRVVPTLEVWNYFSISLQMRHTVSTEFL